MRSAFKMKGFGGFGNSPIKQTKFPNTERRHPKLQKGEMEGTSITGGSESERIIDLEDRIEFLNSDLQDSDSAIEKGQIKTQLSKLNIRLKKARAEK